MNTKTGFSALKIAVLLTALPFFNQCSRNPVTGKKEFILMSESQERSLGVSSDPQIQQEFGVYNDSSLQRYINEKGQAMAKISHRPNLPFQFKVMDSPVVNAFAVPGGFVYFTRGILAHFNNEAQLMGVLGHEIGHVTARHGAEQYTKQMIGQVVLIGAMIASPKLAQYGNELSQGMQLLFLKFSRDNESQSDELGVNYSSKVGYDAKEMAGFFLTLQKLSGGAGQGVPEFLSTHPDPGRRNERVKAMAIETQQKNPKNYDVNRDSYLRLIDGILYGEDPKQGYVSNNVFYHPELKFQFNVPTGWKTQNTPVQFQMASPDSKGMMALTLAEEKSMEAAAAANLEKYKLKGLSQKNVNVNGIPAIIQVADQIADPNGQQQGAQAYQGNGVKDKNEPQTTPAPSTSTPSSGGNAPTQGNRKTPNGTPQPQNQPQNQPSQLPDNGENGVRIITMFIQYNGLMYRFYGASEIKDFNAYQGAFMSSLNSFKALTDNSKINVQADHIRVKAVQNDGTFADALRSFGMPEAKQKELSVLNGMELSDRVSKGMLIKTIGK